MRRLPKLFLNLFLYKMNEVKIEKFLSDRNLKINYDDKDDYVEVDFIKYIFKNEKPIGVIIIHKGYCGWSFCHKNDQWNKLFGIYKAICRLGSKKSMIRVKYDMFGKNDFYRKYFGKSFLGDLGEVEGEEG